MQVNSLCGEQKRWNALAEMQSHIPLVIPDDDLAF